MQKNNIELDSFPLSKIKSIQGSRRLVREKVLQILVSHYVSKVDINELFAHIFFREFNVEQEDEQDDTVEENNNENSENENAEPQKLLTKDEISEMLSDTKIDWRKPDIDFGKQLLNECEKQFEFITTMIKNFSENWDFDRINVTDKTIIIIAAAEILGFPDIPMRATINEAIELTKKYSTDKSYIFVNAVVEKIKRHLIDENLVRKSARGKREK
jgi:transcription antitermination factor NusB